ncbi:hypothetical protein ACLB2K_000705 [Fragaria x ananassa]
MLCFRLNVSCDTLDFAFGVWQSARDAIWLGSLPECIGLMRTEEEACIVFKWLDRKTSTIMQAGRGRA